MKRKFLSTLLFGALACTTLSTVTSCKDYDDDINNLQEQIDKKAALDKVNDLITQVSNVETQAKSAYDLAASKASKEDVEAAKTAATEAAKKAAQEIADAATTKANEAAAAAKAAQETADKAVADAAAANKAAEDVAGKLKDYVLASELKTQLETLKSELEQGSIKDLEDKVKGYDNAINALYSAVTEVSLVGSFTNDKFNTNEGAFDLSFIYGKTGDNDVVFGKDMAVKAGDDAPKATNAKNPYTYTKKTQIDFPTTIVVRINPTNAVVTPEMIKLIDSKGDDLSKVVKVKSVEKYNGLLTATRASETGLWTVELAAADGVDISNMAQTAKVNNVPQHILYAMAVNNTADQAKAAANAADRYVVSTYDITVKNGTPYTKPSLLAFKGLELKSATQQPNWTSITKIANRTEDQATEAVIAREAGASDLLAANGETISIRLNPGAIEGVTEKLANVDRFYVVRDDNFAQTTSSPSEINVWNTYQYAGLGEMVEVKNGTGVGEMSITIPSNLTTGDQVAFRLFAINYDGTYTPGLEYGIPFNVTIVNEKTNASVAGEIIATKAQPETDWLPISGTLKDGAAMPTTEVTVKVAGQNIKLKPSYAKDNQGTAASKNSEIKYVKFTYTGTTIKDWKDNAEAKFNLTTEGANGETVNSVAVTLTKKLPTANDKKYTWRPNQLIDGTYTAYLYPNNSTDAGAEWSANPATSGQQDMNAVIAGLADGDEFTIDGIEVKKVNGQDAYAAAKTFSNDIISIPVAKVGGVGLIDNETPHKMTISHNYGDLSSENDLNPVVVDYETVNVIFADPLAKVWQTLEWADIKTGTDADGNAIYAKGNFLTYGNSTTLANTPFLALLKANNHFNNNLFGGSLKDLLQGNGSFKAKYQSLVSVTDKSGYFTFDINDAKNGISKITPVLTSNPTADVNTTLEIVLKGAFGHEYKYDMDFIVKRVK